MTKTDIKLYNPKNKNSKIITTIKPMLIALFIFGFDYNYFSRNRFLNIISKCYCFFVFLLFVISTLTCCNGTENTVWILLEYLITVIIVFVTSKFTMSFFKQLQNIDSILRIPSEHYMVTSKILISGTAFIWTLRFIYTILYCKNFNCFNSIYLYMPFFFSMTALDLYRFWRTALCNMIRYRIQFLRKRLEEPSESNLYLHISENKTLFSNKLKLFLCLYKRLAEAVDLINYELHSSILVSVVCSLPKMISYVYNIILINENKNVHITIEFISIHLIQISTFLFSPFVVSEFYAIEVEKIQMFLIHKLMEETDTTTKEDIKLFLRYTKFKNFRYRVWRIMPVSITFPLEFINVCTTYVIVLINFSDLYD